MTCIHKSKSNKTEYYIFCNDKIIWLTLKRHRGYSTLLAVHAPTEGR